MREVCAINLGRCLMHSSCDEVPFALLRTHSSHLREPTPSPCLMGLKRRRAVAGRRVNVVLLVFLRDSEVGMLPLLFIESRGGVEHIGCELFIF